MSKLTLEVNQSFVEANSSFKVGVTTVVVTPPLDENYWLARVSLTDKQAIVCFPKFGTIGIGFQHEEDWNTNLPYTCEAEEIWNHIKHNKADKRITRAMGLEAIRKLQQVAKEYKV